jgi:hypothetical protein
MDEQHFVQRYYGGHAAIGDFEIFIVAVFLLQSATLAVFAFQSNY